jgi:hypothetical protein
MPDFDGNVYYSPEQYGLEPIGEINWYEPDYSFDLTVVWISVEGVYYWASDSGCSCPCPFEDTEFADLSSGTFWDLEKVLMEDCTDYGMPQVVDLIARIRNV